MRSFFGFGKRRRTLPVLPLRDEAVLPGTSIWLFCGRTASIAAIEMARDADGLLACFIQKNPSQAEIEDAAELFPIGTTARIKDYDLLPDGTVKIQVEAPGGTVCQLLELDQTGDALVAHVELETLKKTAPKFLAAAQPILQQTALVMDAGRLVPSEALLPLTKLKPDTWLATALAVLQDVQRIGLLQSFDGSSSRTSLLSDLLQAAGPQRQLELLVETFSVTRPVERRAAMSANEAAQLANAAQPLFGETPRIETSDFFDASYFCVFHPGELLHRSSQSPIWHMIPAAIAKDVADERLIAVPFAWERFAGISVQLGLGSANASLPPAGKLIHEQNFRVQHDVTVFGTDLTLPPGPGPESLKRSVSQARRLALPLGRYQCRVYADGNELICALNLLA